VAPTPEPSEDASSLPAGSDAEKGVPAMSADGGEDVGAVLSPLNCAEAGDIPVRCAQNAPCNCTSECSTSEGTGPRACALVCSCDNAENTGAFQCSQDCPPDAAPPADCNAGVTCVPGTECGGDPPVCLCNDKGILECPADLDGG
jgi:hypothetical protein